MGLSSDIISQFVKITNDKPEAKKETTVYGTVVKKDNSTYVQIDGSDLLTPVSATADTKSGERVTVMIKNHTAVVTGNISSPAARTEDVKNVEESSNIQGKRIEDTIAQLGVEQDRITDLEVEVGGIGTMIFVFDNGDMVIGYDNYEQLSGSTFVCGHDVYFGVSNVGSPVTFRPYLRRGDSFDTTFHGSGYVTNDSKDVIFWLPLDYPIVGSPIINVTSLNGFIFRQDGKYTHGSSDTTCVTPDSYEVISHHQCGLCIKATFSDVTDAADNDSIGIYWNGTVTLS